MTIVTVRRAIINLGNIELEVFRMPDASYQLSEQGTASAVGKHNSNAIYFRRSTASQAMPYKNFTPSKVAIEGERSRINCIPFELAAAYWSKEAAKGNLEAVALLTAFAVEGLERRADKVFGIEKTEEQRNVDFAKFIFEWQTTRSMARIAHLGFADACIRKHHPGNLVHDYMTVKIFGDTAEAARMKALVADDIDLDPSIGLNHQDDIDGMRKLANAKAKYTRMTKGSWQEQVERAVTNAR